MRLRMSRKQPQKLAVIRQYMLAVSASLPFAAAGSAISWTSPTLPRILNTEAPVSLDSSGITWMVSLIYLGSIVSAIPSAYLANSIGRQKTLFYSGLLPIISWILILLSTNPAGIYAARLLVGVQIGVTSTIQPIYIREVSQIDVRDTLLTLNSITFNAGSFFVLVVGPFVSYQTLAWLSLVLPLVFLLTFQSAPESPYFMMMKGDVDSARESLLWLRGDLNRIELEFELDQIEKLVELQVQNEGHFKELFSTKEIRKTTIKSLVFSVMKQLSGFSIILAYATVTLPNKSFGVLTPNDCLIIIGAVSVISSLLAACLPHIFGRKRVTTVSYFVCSFSMTVVSVWFFLKSKTQKALFPSVCFVPFLGFLTHAVAFNLDGFPFGGVINFGILPAHLMTKSSAISTIAASTASFFLNKFYLIIDDMEGLYLNYALYAVSCFLAVLFTVCFVPEAKGKTLQDIRDIINDLGQTKVNPSVLARTF